MLANYNLQCQCRNRSHSPEIIEGCRSKQSFFEAVTELGYVQGVAFGEDKPSRCFFEVCYPVYITVDYRCDSSSSRQITVIEAVQEAVGNSFDSFVSFTGRNLQVKLSASCKFCALSPYLWLLVNDVSEVEDELYLLDICRTTRTAKLYKPVLQGAEMRKATLAAHCEVDGSIWVYGGRSGSEVYEDIFELSRSTVSIRRSSNLMCDRSW
jgi:hypothetical protein